LLGSLVMMSPAPPTPPPPCAWLQPRPPDAEPSQVAVLRELLDESCERIFNSMVKCLGDGQVQSCARLKQRALKAADQRGCQKLLEDIFSEAEDASFEGSHFRDADVVNKVNPITEHFHMTEHAHECSNRPHDVSTCNAGPTEAGSRVVTGVSTTRTSRARRVSIAGESVKAMGSLSSRQTRAAKLREVTRMARVTGQWRGITRKRQPTWLPDSDGVKEQVRSGIHDPSYDVRNFYSHRGCCQNVARHPYFQPIVLAVVALNAVWIAVDVEVNSAVVLFQAPAVSQVLEQLFCCFFLAEWLVRFVAFKSKTMGMRDPAFQFDTLLMVLAIFDCWVLMVVMAIWMSVDPSIVDNRSVVQCLNLVRLTRLLRLGRLCRAFPGLMVVFKGMYTARRVVMVVMCLLVATIYMFAISFRQLARDTKLGQRYFSSVTDSARTLLLHGTFPDVADFVATTSSESQLLGVLMIIFVMLSFIVLLSLLTAGMVEMVGVAAAIEQEEMMVKHVRVRLSEVCKPLMEQRAAERGENILTRSDKLGRKVADSQFTRDDFDFYLSDSDVVREIQLMGVDVVGLVDLAEAIFIDGDIFFSDFLELLLQLRGSNVAKVKDIVDLRKVILQEFDRAEQTSIPEALSEMMERTNALERLLQGVAGRLDRGQHSILEALDRRSCAANNELHGHASMTSAAPEKATSQSRRCPSVNAVAIGAAAADAAPPVMLLPHRPASAIRRDSALASASAAHNASTAVASGNRAASEPRIVGGRLVVQGLPETSRNSELEDVSFFHLPT